MSALMYFLAAFGCYAFIVRLRAHGDSMLDVARQDIARIKKGIRGDGLIGPENLETPPTSLFAIAGRQGFGEPEAPIDPPRRRTRRQRGGVEIGPMPDGGGRVRNPNAPCWLCGQKKTLNHKCS